MSPRPFFLFHPLAQGRGPWTPRTTFLRNQGGAFPSISRVSPPPLARRCEIRRVSESRAWREIDLNAISRAASQFDPVHLLSSVLSSQADRAYLLTQLNASARHCGLKSPHPSQRPARQQPARYASRRDTRMGRGIMAPRHRGQAKVTCLGGPLATGRQPTAGHDANRQIRWPLSRRLPVLHASLPNLVVPPPILLLHLARTGRTTLSLVPLGPPRLVREGGESAPREPCTTRQRTRQRTPSHWMTVSAFADVGRCDWLSLTNQWSLFRQVVLECWSLTFPKAACSRL